MKLNNTFLIILLLGGVLTSCKKILVPNKDDHSDFSRVYDDPYFAEGLLMRGYTFLPSGSYRFDEIATSDATTSSLSNQYLRIGTGGWSVLDNPESLWNNCNEAIMYINRFLDIVDTIEWKITDPALGDLYKQRLRGEAYGLRGLFKYYLLRNHGGYGTNGSLLGFPIYNDFLSREAASGVDEFDKPRDKFQECIESAYDDLNNALDLLPPRYSDVSSSSDLPAGFNGMSLRDYNTVFGDKTRQRIDGDIVNAIKSRLALLDASPAFNPDGDENRWEKAAQFAGELIKGVGGINGLDPKGNVFYLKDQVENTELNNGDNMNIKEILWRTTISNSHSLEQQNYPPSLHGNGEVNPSQNLVDAFPMANGLPIDDPGSGYDPDDPYKNRDPRLSLYVVYNGSKLRGETISTGVGSGDDGINSISTSTRTGYYLKKFLREDVNVDPIATNNQRHYVPRIRFTEIFLNYAEAANEAWGPDDTGPFSFSSRDVIAAIRKRGGIKQPDNYLNSITGKDEMREMIHNERRIELCFEGFRFWDIRRWKSDLTVPVEGVKIKDDNFNYFQVESRDFNNSYMHYGPIPNDVIVRFNLEQNQGW